MDYKEIGEPVPNPPNRSIHRNIDRQGEKGYKKGKEKEDLRVKKIIFQPVDGCDPCPSSEGKGGDPLGSSRDPIEPEKLKAKGKKKEDRMGELPEHDPNPAKYKGAVQDQRTDLMLGEGEKRTYKEKEIPFFHSVLILEGKLAWSDLRCRLVDELNPLAPQSLKGAELGRATAKGFLENDLPFGKVQVSQVDTLNTQPSLHCLEKTERGREDEEGFPIIILALRNLLGAEEEKFDLRGNRHPQGELAFLVAGKFLIHHDDPPHAQKRNPAVEDLTVDEPVVYPNEGFHILETVSLTS